MSGSTSKRAACRKESAVQVPCAIPQNAAQRTPSPFTASSRTLRAAIISRQTPSLPIIQRVVSTVPTPIAAIKRRTSTRRAPPICGARRFSPVASYYIASPHPIVSRSGCSVPRRLQRISTVSGPLSPAVAARLQPSVATDSCKSRFNQRYLAFSRRVCYAFFTEALSSPPSPPPKGVQIC